MIPQNTKQEALVPTYRLFLYGSAECDQYETPNDDSFESRRPIEQLFFLKNSIKIHQIACGALHTLVLSTTGQLFSWGCNDDGALGRETANKDAESEENSEKNSKKNNEQNIEETTEKNNEENIEKKNEENINKEEPKQPKTCAFPPTKESYPGLVPLDLPVDLISAGDSHSVACNSRLGTVFLWGVYRNTIGGNMCTALRKPTRWGESMFSKKKIKKVISGCNHSLVLAEERVYAWGDPDTCVLGRMPLARRKFTQGLYIEALSNKHVLDVYTGGYHSFIKQKVKLPKKDSKEKKEIETIMAWGLNNYGQLGIGSTENSYKAQEISRLRGVEVKDIQGGEDFTVFLTNSGEIFACGRCDDGQCGLGENWKEQLNKALEKGQIEKKGKQDDSVDKNIEKTSNETIEKNNEKAIQKSVENIAEKTDNIIEKNEEKTTEMLEQNVKETKKFEFITIPLKIESLENIDQIYCGAGYSYAISREKNQVYSWGNGDHYVLGTGKEEEEMAPYSVKPAFFKQEEVVKLGLGGQHVAVITCNSSNNAWKLPEIDEKVLEIVQTGKKKGRKPKSVDKKQEVSIDEEEKSQEKEEKRNVKKRKMQTETKNEKIKKIKKNDA